MELVLRRMNMPAAKNLLFLFALLFFLPVSARADTTAQQVVAKVMQAYGGQAAVEQIKSVCAKGRIIAYAFNAHGSYSYCLAMGRKLRVDIGYTRYSEHRVLNGHRVKVQQGEEGPKVLSGGPNYRSVVYQYEQLSLPRALLSPTVRVLYDGREQYRGRPADVLSLQAEGSPVLKVYVDSSSGRMVKTSGIIQMGGAQMVLSSEYDDFRKVGNTIFPFKLTNYAGGEKIAETTIKSYELNSKLDGSTFRISDPAME